MKKSPQYNQQTESKQCKFEAEEICIYQKPGKWPLPHLYLKISSGFYARKIPKQQYLKLVTFSDAKNAFMFTTIQPREYTEQTIQYMRKS